MDLPPLLSKSTLLELGMLKINPEGLLKEANDLRIKAAKLPASETKTLLNESSQVFQGIGCFRDKDTGKGIDIKLEMDSTATPVAQKPQQVPYHLQTPL